MTVDSVLINAKLFTHGHILEGGLAIDDGKIVKIAKLPNLPNASSKIDVKGNLILPGLIDVHVHLRNQKLAYKENFSSGTAAAAAGGVTCVVDMPNNKPVTADAFSLNERMRVAKEKILVNVGFNSAFPKKLEEMANIVKTGAIGFKVYLSGRISEVNVTDDDELLSVFKEAAKCGVPVAVHAENGDLIELRKQQMENMGNEDIDAFCFVHSPEVEVQSITRLVKLVKKSGVHLHFCHLSSASGLEAILLGKKEGLPITLEVTPHNLLLTDYQYKISGNSILTTPPLRHKRDVESLWDALTNGLVDVIASDHAPHALIEKNCKSVWKVKPGIPGLETTLPLLLNRVNENLLTLSELVKVTSEAPARIFNITKRGFLHVGYWADLTIVDLKRDYKIDSSNFFSKAKYSPFDGFSGKGKPVKTFVNGNLVMDEGQIFSNSKMGKIIRNSNY